MKKSGKFLILVVAVGAILSTGCGGGSAEKGETESADLKVDSKNVQAGDVDIKTSEGKANVKMPGLEVNSDADGAAKVNMPGLKVDSDKNGNAKINIGGLNIDVSSDGEDSKVEMNGSEIDSGE
ncbi:MAG: hypothetical protein ACQETH_08555 [Candidatus Rifleibacteriota bacterium]